jgi:PleD family two-component response regulator
MSAAANKRILAVLEDLFFTVKINESAKRVGLPIEFVKSEHDVVARCADPEAPKPMLIIVDLNFGGIDPLKLIGTLKASEATKSINLIGYLSHLQGELKQAAQEAGCDMVMARSAFSQNLPQILRRYAGN